MIVRVAFLSIPRSRLLPPNLLPLFPLLAGFGQVGGHIHRGHAVLDLGVGDGAVLLSKMQPQLTLVTEVQVAFFTLVGRKKRKKTY